MAALLLNDVQRWRSKVRDWFFGMYRGTIKNILGSEALRTLLLGLIYVYVVVQAFQGLISVGAIMMYIGAISRFSNAISEFGQDYVYLARRSLYIRDYLSFLDELDGRRLCRHVSGQPGVFISASIPGSTR